MKQYGSLLDNVRRTGISAKREFAIEKQTVYQGSVLTVNHYRLEMPGGKVIERDIVERPESVLVLPMGQKNNVILIEEYDLAADTWQLTLPGGKVIDPTPEGIRQQVQTELREETGFRAGKLEKLLDFYSHPGYVAHKVHLLVAYDLEWDPLEMDDGEEIRVHTFTLEEALNVTRIDFRCDPEAALALRLYVGLFLINQHSIAGHVDSDYCLCYSSFPTTSSTVSQITRYHRALQHRFVTSL